MVEWYIITIILTDGAQGIRVIVDCIGVSMEGDLRVIVFIVKELDYRLTMTEKYGMTDYVLEPTDLLNEGKHDRYWCN